VIRRRPIVSAILLKPLGRALEHIVDIIGPTCRPTCDILIKIHGVFEHISEPIDRVCVPTRDIFIERPGVVKHTLAISDFGEVPSADARAGERTRASEHVPHLHT